MAEGDQHDNDCKTNRDGRQHRRQRILRRIARKFLEKDVAADDGQQHEQRGSRLIEGMHRCVGAEAREEGEHDAQQHRAQDLGPLAEPA